MTTPQARYVTHVLDQYRTLPGTFRRVLRQDRRTALALFRRGVHLDIVHNAFVLALARRTLRSDTHDLEPIRCLQYFLPVVDELGRLVGVLSDRDVLRTPSPRKRRIAEVMTRDVVTVHPQAPAADAAALMLQHNVSSVMVVDEAGTLVGLVTMTDYVDLARRSLLGLPLER